MQQTSAGLGHRCFDSDSRLQPALLSGLFAAPSGFHNSFLSFSNSNLFEATATARREEPRLLLFSLFLDSYVARHVPMRKQSNSGNTSKIPIPA